MKQVVVQELTEQEEVPHRDLERPLAHHIIMVNITATKLLHKPKPIARSPYLRRNGSKLLARGLVLWGNTSLIITPSLHYLYLFFIMSL